MRGSGSNDQSGATQAPTWLVSRCLTSQEPARPEEASGASAPVSGVSLVSGNLQITNRTIKRQEEGLSAAVSRPLRQARHAHEQTTFELRQGWGPNGAGETRAALPRSKRTMRAGAQQHLAPSPSNGPFEVDAYRPRQQPTCNHRMIESPLLGPSGHGQYYVRGLVTLAGNAVPSKSQQVRSAL
jgi:hypothetical protein